MIENIFMPCVEFFAGIWLGKAWKNAIFYVIFSCVINILKVNGGL